MSDKLHDDITNIVTSLQGVIPALQNLTQLADESVNNRLDETLNKIDKKVSYLDETISKLNQATGKSSHHLIMADEQALSHLKQGVELLVNTNVKDEYRRQIQSVIDEIAPLISEKVDREIEVITSREVLSIEHHNEQIQQINDSVKSDMQNAITAVAESIERLNQLVKTIDYRADNQLEELNTLSMGHTETLKDIQRATGANIAKMDKNLESIKSHAVFMAQSPTALTAITAGILNLGFLFALVYTYKLWLAFFVSLIVIGVVAGAIWGLVYWIGTLQTDD